jgi:cystine transport system substrate-binding protein
MLRRRLLSSVAIALAVLIVPAVGGAHPSHSVSSLRARDAEIAAKSRAAVLGLYSLDQQLATSQSRLAALHQRALSLRAQRAVLTRELSVAHRGERLAQHDLGVQVRELYEQGTVEPLEIVLGAKSLDDAMTSIDSLTQASKQGESILAQLKVARHRIASESHVLATREAALAAATRAAEATAASLARSRAARSAYISSLASQRRLNERQISRLVAQARAAQERSAILARARISADTVAAPVTALPLSAPASAGAVSDAGGRTITVSATGYSLPGSTATGLPVGWGVVAVDPAVIPLGTHMSIPGYGEAVAADTGGAIVGNTIDLWFPSVAQANAWGRRTVTIVLH